MTEHIEQLYQQEIRQSQAAIDELDRRMRHLSQRFAAAQAELVSAQAQIEATEVLLAETEVAGIIAKSRLETAQKKLSTLKSKKT